MGVCSNTSGKNLKVNGGGLEEDHTSTRNFIGIRIMRTLSLLVYFKCYVWEGIARP